MTPALAAVAPPADAPAARFVLVLFVGVLIGAGLMRALDWWDTRAARPACLNCGVAGVGEVGQYCARCTGRLHRPIPCPATLTWPSGAVDGCRRRGVHTEHLGIVSGRRWSGCGSTHTLLSARASHGVVSPPDRRWEG